MDRSHNNRVSLRVWLYLGPAYNKLRTVMVDQAKAKLQAELEKYHKLGLKTKYVLMCDGWTDPQGRPLMNFLEGFQDVAAQLRGREGARVRG